MTFYTINDRGLLIFQVLFRQIPRFFFIAASFCSRTKVQLNGTKFNTHGSN